MNRSLALFASALVAVGCSSTTSDSAMESGGGSDAASGGQNAAPSLPNASAGGGDESGSSSSGGTASSDSSQPGAQPQAGQLTAGVWDDNLNFDFFSDYAASSELSLSGLPIFDKATRTAARAKFATPTAKQELDLAFLFDTTGSMGDELSYLQAEIDDIASRIASEFPSLTTRWGLVLYRDYGDAYLTQSFDFTSDLGGFKTKLAQQSAAGGGDYPEAVPEGLAKAGALSWRSDANVARMTFWIADAPGHTNEAAATKTAIETAVDKDIHLYPVAASGTDPRAEYAFRSAAQITGGRYIFLTDDSGIGNSHAEPHIPCYVVTRFDTALVRMVESEMKGQHVFAPDADVLRTVGTPVEGQCSTQSSGTVTLY